jgi:hypothetical protein
MKWIQWMIDNAWTLVIIGGVLMQLLQAMTKKKDGDEAPPEAEQAKEYEFEDPDLAERTRKIREEIQRKIDQRAHGQSQPSGQAASPVAPPPIIREVTSKPVIAPVQAHVQTQRQAEIMEEQAAWASKLEAATRMKAAAVRRTEFEESTADHTVQKRSGARHALMSELGSPEALRRAFVLREVLGPPVALRK